MSDNVSLFSFAAFGVTAFALVAGIFVSTDFARAADAPPATPGCTCPQSDGKTSIKPKLAALNPPLDERDEIATLQSLQFALTEVADGSSYVWHRAHGRLSGLVQVTGSYKNAQGAVCRKAIVVLNSLDDTKKIETIACRLGNRSWQLGG